MYNKIGNVSLSQSYLDNDIPVMVEDAFLNDETVLGISDLVFEMVDRDAI